MGKGKGFLKKLSGGLKMAAVFTPMAIGIAGFLVCMGGLIGMGVNKAKIQSFKNTTEYSEIFTEDARALDAAYKNEEISTAEYNKKLEYLDTEEYVKDLVKNDERAADFKGYIKQHEMSTVTTFSGLGIFLAGGVFSAVWYSGDIAENIQKSAESDFNYAANNGTIQTTIIGGKKFKGSEDEEELPNIEDNCYSD